MLRHLDRPGTESRALGRPALVRLLFEVLETDLGLGFRRLVAQAALGRVLDPQDVTRRRLQSSRDRLCGSAVKSDGIFQPAPSSHSTAGSPAFFTVYSRTVTGKAGVVGVQRV